MEDVVFIKGENLHIHYEVFSPFEFRRTVRKDVVPVKDINFILEHVGVKGGFHGFEIIGFEKRGHPAVSDRYESEYEALEEYGKKSSYILEEIKEILPKIQIQTVTETGSAYV